MDKHFFGLLNDRGYHRFKRRIFRIIAFILLLPIALLFIYRIPLIHPPSTLMIRDDLFWRDYEHSWRPLSEISPYLQSAVLLSEDGQFCAHHGVDWHQLRLALSKRGGPTRGASTITMQMVKNLYLWHGRSYLRKGLEIPYALIADALLPSRRIMEIYLNIAEWGPGVYGAEAAARHYFNRSARNLTPRQAIYLAVALPNPKIRNPARPSAHLTQLMRSVSRRMSQGASYVECLKQ